MIVLAVFTDGRADCIRATIPSALAHLDGQVTRRVIFDDSGNERYADWLRDEFYAFQVVSWGERKGFAAAVAAGWHWLAGETVEPFVFHLEDDFTFNRPVPVDLMLSVLSRNPHVVQMALRRQAWNDIECAAGGVVEAHPEAYEDRTDQFGNRWLEHRQFFTCNPSLYRRTLLELGWPQEPASEAVFAGRALADPDARSGYWGARTDSPWVHHIGAIRVGTGY